MSSQKSRMHPGIIVAIITGLFAVCTTLITVLGGPIISLLFKEKTPTPVVQTLSTNDPATMTSSFVPTVTTAATDASPATNPTESGLPTATSTETTQENNTFVERFDDNSNGWALSNSARLSQGKLVITVNRGDSLWLTVPNHKVSDGFTMQAEMTITEGHACSSAMGFAIGEGQVNNYSFLFTGGGCGGSEVGIYENNIEDFITPLIGITLNRNITYPMSLELKNGTYTLYINGTSTTSAPITRAGDDIGIYVWRFNNGFSPGESTYFVDNVILQNDQ